MCAPLSCTRAASPIAVTRSRTSLSKVDFPLPVAPCTPMALAPISSNRVRVMASPVSGMIPTGTGSRIVAAAGNQPAYGDGSADGHGTVRGWYTMPFTDGSARRMPMTSSPGNSVVLMSTRP